MRYVKSPVLIAGVPSPSSSRFSPPSPLPCDTPATQARRTGYHIKRLERDYLENKDCMGD